MLLSLMFRCRAEVAQDATQCSLKRMQSKAIETRIWNRWEKSSISATNEKGLVRFLVRFSKMTQIEQAGLSRYLTDGIEFELVDAVGIEPTTCRLRVNLSLYGICFVFIQFRDG